MMKMAEVAALQGSKFDLIVVGGGINGTAIAREAALRGIKTALVERDDLSSATSAWNSRLVHGGLRYLENLEIRLVRESLRDREWLIRNAPHLVRPLPIIVPFLPGSKRPAWLLRLGMIAYDVLSFDKSLPRHKILNRRKLRLLAPGVAGAAGGARYYDAQVTYAERLSVENALQAAGAGAAILTHTSAEKLLIDNGQARGVAVRDVIDGSTAELSASVIINATGPWVDSLLAEATTSPAVGRLIGGSSGTHFIVDPWPGASDENVYFEARADGRPVMAIPWEGRRLIGSTDRKYSGDPGQVAPSEEDVEYLLGEMNGVFPEAGLSRESILFAYTGIRPLPYEPGVPERKVTRSHVVRDHGRDGMAGVLSIIGGKLTTFHTLGQHAVRAAERHLRRKSQPVDRQVRFPGAQTADFSAFEREFLSQTALPSDVARRALRIYGTRVARLEEMVAADPALGKRLWKGAPAVAAEVVLAVREEHARTVEDIVMRRTMLGLDPGNGPETGQAVAGVLVNHCGWDVAAAQAGATGYEATWRRFRMT
jgi:glycerol-3-phosphate dehydrogenase